MSAEHAIATHSAQPMTTAENTSSVPASSSTSTTVSSAMPLIGDQSVMPVHCAMYVDAAAKRRLSCFKLERARDANEPDHIVIRFGDAAPSQIQRLLCTCAPVHDYTGRQVARIGVARHGAEERPFSHEQTGAAMELARSISLRLGHLPAVSVA